MVWRVLAAVDGDVLDGAISAWIRWGHVWSVPGLWAAVAVDGRSGVRCVRPHPGVVGVYLPAALIHGGGPVPV